MPNTDFLTYGYAALVATGGLIGYVKAGNISIDTLFFKYVRKYMVFAPKPCTNSICTTCSD